MNASQYRFFWLTCWTISLLALGSGCSHYRLGNETPPPFGAIFVSPVQNQSFLPQASAAATQALVTAFQKDGRVTVSETRQTAAVLTVKLTGYSREAATSLPRDTGVGFSFLLTLSAQVTLVAPDGQTLLNAAPVQVDLPVFDYGQLKQAEYEAAPLLFRRLAAQVCNLALSNW